MGQQERRQRTVGQRPPSWGARASLGKAPMGALRVGGRFWVSTHPDLVALEAGREVLDLPMRRVYSARGGAWIPWQMGARAGGKLVAYGADDAWSREVRHEIGWMLQGIALYGREAATWVRWRHPVLDVLGEHRAVAVRGDIVVVGGFGQQPRVLRAVY